MPQKIEAYTYKKVLNINDDYIVNYFFSKNKKRLLKNKLINIPREIINYLKKRYNDSFSLKETIYRIKNNIINHPLCPICNNPVKYIGGTRFYLKTCGNTECSEKLNKISLKNTIENKYGTDNISKLDSIKEKVKNTNLKKYGCVSPLQNSFIKEKTKKTNLKKYGVEFSQSSKEIKDKIYSSLKNTLLEKYGVDNPNKVLRTV